MENKLLRTRTIKLQSSPFDKVKMKMKIIEIEFDFIKDKEFKSGIILMMGLGVDNGQSIRSLLKDKKFSDEDIDAVIETASKVYNLDLTHIRF